MHPHQRSGVGKRKREKPRRTQEQRRTETRRKLIDAAIELLHDAGFARFTIGAVAARAHLTSGAVQHHFPSSQELLRGVIESIYPMLQIQVSEISRQAVWVRVERIVDLYWHKLYGHPNYLVIWELTFGTREQDGFQALLKTFQRDIVAKAVCDLTRVFADVDMHPSMAFRLWTFIGSQLRGLALLSIFEERRVLNDDLKLLKDAVVHLIANLNRRS